MKLCLKLMILGCSGAAFAMAAGCRRGDQEVNVTMDTPPLLESNPNAKAVEVVFPREERQSDDTLNKFIEDALATCASGDYDRFRQLFGATYNPPNKADFDKIWYEVKNVRVL